MPMSLKSKTSIAMKIALTTLGKVKWKILTSPERKKDQQKVKMDTITQDRTHLPMTTHH